MSGLLRRLKVAFPEIDVHGGLRLRYLTPQLARLEAHAVKRLGAAAAPVRMRVGQDVDAVEEMDAPAMPARIARQPRVTARLPVAREDGIAGLEARGGNGLALLRHALADHVHDAREQLRVLAIGEGLSRIRLEVPGARVELLALDHAFLDEER